MKKENIDHTAYASIAIRIESEIKRMRRVFSLEADAAYEEVPTKEFLVSKARYKSIAAIEERTGENKQPAFDTSPAVHIDTVNIEYAADSQAVSNLERLEKETTIGANFSNIVTALRTLFGG